MSEQKIEGIPDGWGFVRVGRVKRGEFFVDNLGTPYKHVESTESHSSNYVIIRKIEQPKQYRPFANAAEFEQHRDRWFRPKCSPDQCILTTAYNDRGHWTAKEQDTWEAMFELYTFDDGSPFGVEVTE